MTSLKKVIEALIYINTGFTVGHGLLCPLIIVNSQLYCTISYHYSDSIIWYTLMFGLPLLTGIAFYLWFRRKIIAKSIKILFGFLLMVQLAFTIVSATKNFQYWGYAFKRPMIFTEIKDASTIIECSKVTNYHSGGIKSLYVVHDTTNSLEELYGRKDPYYGNVDRPFMVFQDQSHKYPDLYHYADVYYDTSKNLPPKELESMDAQIRKTGIIDKGDRTFNYDYLGQLNGIVTKFSTPEQKTFIFAGLKGREISNDHYPYYEFLFIEDNGHYRLFKKQKYYTDFAGKEGLEYANLAPAFSLLLSITGAIFLIIQLTIIKIITKVKKK